MTLSGSLVFFTNWVKAYIGSPDWWVCCFERRFRVHMGNDTSSWSPNVTAFLKALSLHRFCSTCTPTTCQLHVAENSFMLTTYVSPLSELECSLSSDMARMSHFCWQWWLKPSASKTIGSVFHLHSTSATRKLSVYLDGQRLWHECHPTYFGVTLDCMLFYREHLTKTAGKLKNRDNLLMKLASSTWGANTLQSSALALCYSAAEYCIPVWSRSAHTSLVDVQLNSTMRLISGILCSTPLTWLPVLSNIEPPALRRKAATD